MLGVNNGWVLGFLGFSGSGFGFWNVKTQTHLLYTLGLGSGGPGFRFLRVLVLGFVGCCFFFKKMSLFFTKILKMPFFLKENQKYHFDSLPLLHQICN